MPNKPEKFVGTHVMVSSFNTDIKKHVFVVMEKTDYRLTDERFNENYKDVIGQVTSFVKEKDPRHYGMIGIAVAAGIKFRVYRDNSANYIKES